MKHIGIGALALLALIVTMGLLRGPQPAHAQDKATVGGAHVTAAQSFFTGLYQNGRTIRTGKQNSGQWVSFQDIPEGDYELRIEAQGYRPQVMRIHVAAGHTDQYISDPPKGEVPEIWGKGPTLAELTERITNLEKQIEELKKKTP